MTIFLQGYFRIFLFLFAIITLSACNSEASKPLSLKATVENHKGTELGQQINHALLAEIYNQLDEPILAASHYQSLSIQTNDPAITKRATEIAAKTGQIDVALNISKQWVQLSPESLEANQYKALLLLRSDKFESSAEQLQRIRDLVEKEETENQSVALYSKGLKFIGSMLSIESHHKKSLSVYELYLKKYGNEVDHTQQNLILASLAMKAENYQSVISSIDDIKEKEFLQIANVVLLKTRALKELNQLSDAVKVLKVFVDEQESSDSTKLELVRLLILDKQKSTAGQYLKKLVKKHPNNKDLLKSLIALEIDQSQLNLAKVNIKRLKESAEYQSDAEYFTGEVMEAEGDFQHALESYRKVKKGKLLKRAQNKIVLLSQKLDEKNTQVNVKFKKTLLVPLEEEL